MELVEGRTLRDLLESGPIPLRRLLSIAAQIADGLAKAHTAGIVHRDLKPENVMVSRDGFVKILDFGLAKLLPTGFEASDGPHSRTVTRGTEPGMILGTVGYMSPEQASGHPADFRSDHFSLGAILYEMAAGKRAFDRSTAVQTLSAVIQDEPEPISAAAPKIPANLVWIIERCLAKDPEDRYASSRDLARDLAALRDHASGISVSAVGQPAPRRFRPSRALLAGGVSLASSSPSRDFSPVRGFSGDRDRQAPPPARKTLTFRRGFLTGARFAPDGQTIVYSASWDGKPSEIFTTRVGSSEARPLGIFPAGILAISSAGEMAISLGCENRWDPCFGTLARVPLAGGAPREVLEDVSSADWSPDGKELAVIHAVAGRDRIEYPIGKVLYQTDGFLTSVRVSPKGDLVAFLDHPSGDSARNPVRRRPQRPQENTDPEWPRIHGTLWSPDGRRDLLRRLAGSQEFRDSYRESLRPHPRGLVGSRIGRRLPRRSVSGHRQIQEHPPGHPGRRSGLPRERNLSWLADSTAADLSPDGRQLLFYEYSGESSMGAESFVTYLAKDGRRGSQAAGRRQGPRAVARREMGARLAARHRSRTSRFFRRGPVSCGRFPVEASFATTGRRSFRTAAGS